MKSAFLKSGHLPTLISCFLYFDFSFAIWVLLGPLAVLIASDLHLDAGQSGLMVAVPVLAGAGLRFLNGILVGQWQPRRVGLVMQLVVIAGLLTAWPGWHSQFLADPVAGRDPGRGWRQLRHRPADGVLLVPA